MTTTTTQSVWEQRYDRIYQCRVERGDNSEGRLSIAYVGNGRPLIIHRQNVALEYGSHFGADNVAEWQATCDDCIRFPELRNPSQ